jgi:hypothetical protein
MTATIGIPSRKEADMFVTAILSLLAVAGICVVVLGLMKVSGGLE